MKIKSRAQELAEEIGIDKIRTMSRQTSPAVNAKEVATQNRDKAKAIYDDKDPENSVKGMALRIVLLERRVQALAKSLELVISLYGVSDK